MLVKWLCQSANETGSEQISSPVYPGSSFELKWCIADSDHFNN